MKMESDVLNKIKELEKRLDELGTTEALLDANPFVQQEASELRAKIQALNWVTNLSQEI